MLVVGAGGLAGQMFTDLVTTNAQDIVFWSEVDTKYYFIKEKYKIIQTDEEVKEYFRTVSDEFILCISSLENRKKLSERFKNLGGRIATYISPFSEVSPYSVSIGEGTTIMSHVIIESLVTIGNEVLLNKTSNIGHGSMIGNYVEVAPGVILLGEVEIGENVYIGTGAIILPKVKIGDNSVIAAGTVVKKRVPENSLVSGVPGSVVKTYQK